MRPPRLVVGNFTTSPRSLAVWYALVRAGFTFTLERFDLYAEGAAERLFALSPHGRLPILSVDGIRLDEPFAIVEYVAEGTTGLWPADPLARARARGIVLDLLYGFPELEALLPFDALERFGRPERLTRLQGQELARLRRRLEELPTDDGETPGRLQGAALEAFVLPWAWRLRSYDLFEEEETPLDRALGALLERPEVGVWESWARQEREGGSGQEEPWSLGRADAPTPHEEPPPVPVEATPEPRVRPGGLFRRRQAPSEPAVAEPAGGTAAPRPPEAPVKPIDPAAARRRRRS